MYINTLWSKLVYVCVGRCMCVGGGVRVCGSGEGGSERRRYTQNEICCTDARSFHCSLVPRPFTYCKQQKAGRGLETRLFPVLLPPYCWDHELGVHSPNFETYVVCEVPNMHSLIPRSQSRDKAARRETGCRPKDEAKHTRC